ncbi:MULTISPECIES: hypothetical protein [unclassified Nonomuraea]
MRLDLPATGVCSSDLAEAQERRAGGGPLLLATIPAPGGAGGSWCG